MMLFILITIVVIVMDWILCWCCVGEDILGGRWRDTCCIRSAVVVLVHVVVGILDWVTDIAGTQIVHVGTTIDTIHVVGNISICISLIHIVIGISIKSFRFIPSIINP